MSDPYDVKPNERGVVRVFVNDPESQGDAAITAESAGELLGEGLDLDPKYVEVFPARTVDAMGLSTYLQEGYGIPPEDLKEGAAELDALKGRVILVASPAFQGKPATLSPDPGLRFLGAYREPGMAPPEPMPAPESATGRIAPQDSAPPPPTGRRPGTGLILAALLIAAALVLFLVL